MTSTATVPAEAFTLTPRTQEDLPPERQLRVTCRPLTIAERARVLDEMEHIIQMPDGTRVVKNLRWQQALALAVAHILRIDNLPPGVPDYPADAPAAAKQAWLNQHVDDLTWFAIGNEVREHSLLPADAGN